MMVFPEPPFKAAMMILGERFNTFFLLRNDTFYSNQRDRMFENDH
jgi:hypothetical protein